jgi:hypothetical protein
MATILLAGREHSPNTRAGVICFWSSHSGYAWPSNDADLEDEDRWLHVWPIGLRTAYLDMIDFITTRLDPDW